MLSGLVMNKQPDCASIHEQAILPFRCMAHLFKINTFWSCFEVSQNIAQSKLKTRNVVDTMVNGSIKASINPSIDLSRNKLSVS